MVKNLKKAVETGETIPQEASVVDVDGKEIWFHSTIVPVADEEGRIDYLIVVSIDTTARNQAEKELVNKEKSLSNAQRIAGLARWDLDIVNDSCVMIGDHSTIYGDDKLVYKNSAIDTWLKTVHPDDHERLRKIFQQGIKQGDHFNFDYRVMLPDGTICYAHDRAEVIRDGCGNAIRITGITQDVTRYKKIEQALTLARDEADRANLAKSQFLSRMSHELRTPMNAILGFGQVLELNDDGFDEIQKGNIREILDAGYHLLNLINDVLDLAKIESGKMEVFMEEIAVDDVLQQCINLISSQAKARQLELINNISGKGYTVQADITRLKQVLLNILSNAVKYNREQGRISLNSEAIDKHRIRISVTDTGEGMTEDDIDKLYTPFERMGAESNIEGSGIGLVITKYLIELMGGAMGVESTLGEGSTFWVELEFAP